MRPGIPTTKHMKTVEEVLGGGSLTHDQALSQRLKSAHEEKKWWQWEPPFEIEAHPRHPPHQSQCPTTDADGQERPCSDHRLRDAAAH
jgi:hypothetical protein